MAYRSQDMNLVIGAQGEQTSVLTGHAGAAGTEWWFELRKPWNKGQRPVNYMICGSDLYCGFLRHTTVLSGSWLPTFRRNFRLTPHGRRWRQHVPPKYSYPLTRSHGVIFHKTIIWVTSNECYSHTQPKVLQTIQVLYACEPDVFYLGVQWDYRNVSQAVFRGSQEILERYPGDPWIHFYNGYFEFDFFKGIIFC
jgi:hypothetical protein